MTKLKLIWAILFGKPWVAVDCGEGHYTCHTTGYRLGDRYFVTSMSINDSNGLYKYYRSNGARGMWRDGMN